MDENSPAVIVGMNRSEVRSSTDVYFPDNVQYVEVYATVGELYTLEE